MRRPIHPTDRIAAGLFMDYVYPCFAGVVAVWGASLAYPFMPFSRRWNVLDDVPSGADSDDADLSQTTTGVPYKHVYSPGSNVKPQRGVVMDHHREIVDKIRRIYSLRFALTRMDPAFSIYRYDAWFDDPSVAMRGKEAIMSLFLLLRKTCTVETLKFEPTSFPNGIVIDVVQKYKPQGPFKDWEIVLPSYVYLDVSEGGEVIRHEDLWYQKPLMSAGGAISWVRWVWPGFLMHFVVSCFPWGYKWGIWGETGKRDTSY
ncbi:unnamed protein product [Vitrella brassicaformis CCMP3155]|uniref:Uncharacterized protein n=2 Tax=Vitrella brassicaformis TaxID=1169539 RepID=A0A0G4H299_VITBC|nr:unnamed protein product [Vitrella brassicaformis CCMP3155]|mmetsp:Transcript_9969/g.24213  ORF Transcript_9969/g.24213 Transcript_9969/m.24213 type:complete len:259 (+) Transcript_9969:84-860(+)|eukprot:CEM37765.1 unnamed protein product [Vitrella brassicaformis CCMP3155]